ncbi:tRNA uracil 4-sulfurtransferase ThiI [[Mycoplasma] anseris]|uniref:Probable tRNA sulfurtransferase n=1 Tax=[Mycoplasma] anseris TaxID=92400 RepID=A0A2Z4NDF2_9BACT|nr:tRNA uracil 4-sulfurtransferase ThiI [[Mycoplasma] anseris]AWX69536.1 tRNA 4-thiouridine(8) synthase ThiI [[Mycoplasma] anseris]
MTKKILIRYGELTLKGENKIDFINKLKENILLFVAKEDLKMEYDRAFLNYSEANLKALQYIFGISSYSIVYQVESNLLDIEDMILELIKDKEFNSFAINAKRHDKNFPMTSNEVNMHFGGIVLRRRRNANVNLTNPDLEISIEIRDKYSYIFIDRIKGLGGMPLKSEGNVLHLMSGGIDSPVAAYLLQKRGLKVTFLNFITPPQTDDTTVKKVEDLIKELAKYQGNAYLYQLNYSDLMNYIGLTSNQKYKITLMRRSFYRIANKLAKRLNIKAISNGESLGQVASQTLESIHTISEASDLPVFRPLISFDKNETIKIANEINTFHLSIIKACETCELFAPKKPITKPNIEEAKKLEAELTKLNELEDKILENITYKKIIANINE